MPFGVLVWVEHGKTYLFKLGKGALSVMSFFIWIR